jgi:hypothetical protein
MSFEAVDFYVKDTTPQKNPVAGVVVKVLTADGRTVYGQDTTDSDGHVGFLLPSEVPLYQARFFKFSVTFTNPLQFSVLPSPLTPPQSNTFDVPGTLVSPPVPTDARLCTAYGFFRGPDGSPAPHTEIHFMPKFNPLWVEGAGVLKERVIVRTDAAGYVQVNLFRNGQYDCTIAGEEEITRHIDVPDLPNCNVVDLIFPIPASVVYDPPGPYTLHVGDTLTLVPTVTASDGEDLGVDIADVQYRSDDTTVLGVQPSSLNVTILGLAPGTANIVVKRLDNSIVHIPDPGIAGSPQLVTVIP